MRTPLNINLIHSFYWIMPSMIPLQTMISTVNAVLVVNQIHYSYDTLLIFFIATDFEVYEDDFFNNSIKRLVSRDLQVIN